MDLTGLVTQDTNKGIVCVDFGAGYVKIAYLKPEAGGVALLKYALKSFSPQPDTDAGARDFIKDFINKNSVIEKDVFFNITDPDAVFIKNFSLPFMPKDELFEAVKWQVQDSYQFNPDECLFDYQVIREYTDAEGAKKIDLLGVFIKEEVIKQYLALLASCSLSCQSISVNPFSYLAILNSLPAAEKPVAVLDIGQFNSQLSIYKDNKVVFVRNLGVSSSKIIESLTGMLLSGQGKIALNLEKAALIAAEFGIPENENIILRDGIKSGYIISLLRPVLENMIKELQRSLEYFNSLFPQGAINVLYITGEGSVLKNLDSYISKELNLKVERLPLPPGFNLQAIDKQTFLVEQPQLGSLIGLALEPSAKVNLVPHEIKSRKVELWQEMSLRVFFIAAAAVLLVSLFIIGFQIRDYRARLKNIRLQLGNSLEIKQLKRRIDIKQELIDAALKDKVPVYGVLRLLSNVTPKNIILVQLSINQESHSLILTGNVFAGKDPVETVLTGFISKLESSPFFKEVNLASSKEAQGANQFEIKCDLVK